MRWWAAGKSHSGTSDDGFYLGEWGSRLTCFQTRCLLLNFSFGLKLEGLWRRILLLFFIWRRGFGHGGHTSSGAAVWHAAFFFLAVL